MKVGGQILRAKRAENFFETQCIYLYVCLYVCSLCDTFAIINDDVDDDDDYYYYFQCLYNNERVHCAGNIGFPGKAVDVERDISVVYEYVRFFPQESCDVEGQCKTIFPNSSLASQRNNRKYGTVDF